MPGGGGDEQTTATGPSAFQQPYLDALFKGATDRFNAEGPEFFQGNTVAGFDPATVAAQEQVIGQTAPAVQDFVTRALGTSNDILGGKYLDPNQDPNLQASLDAGARPLTQSLTESILPNIRSGAAASRSVGGSRQGIAEGLASGRTQDAIGDVSSNILSANRLAGLDQITKTLALAPQTAAVQAAPQTLLDAVGTQRQGMAQAKIDADIAKWNYEQTLPDQKLAQYNSIVNSGGYGSTTTSSGGGPPSVAQGALGGAALGASVGSFGGPWGTAIGAAVGAIGGAVAANSAQ